MAESPVQPEAMGKPSRVKMILMVLTLLAGEAGVIIGAMLLVGREPQVATADPGFDPLLVEEEKIIEVLVLDGKLPNAKTGVTFIYDTEIYVQVKQKHAERVTGEIGQFFNEIKAEITAIWRTSEPHHFQEPKLETLTRKVFSLLQDRFGTDVETGEPVLSKCVIVMGTGFRVDG